MDTALDEKLRYPIGRFKLPDNWNSLAINDFISSIEALPKQIEAEINGISSEELELVYRPGGWNIRQLINHLVDSHMNSLIRFKLGLTENLPTIKPYDETQWAMLADTKNCPVQITLQLLDGLHKRWVILLRSMNQEDWERKVFNPESKREWSLKQLAALYSWHGKHHLEHIRIAKLNK